MQKQNRNRVLIGVLLVAVFAIVFGGVLFWKQREDARRESEFREQLATMMQERDEAESGMITALDEIDAALDSVRYTAGHLSLSGQGSEASGKRERIIANVRLMGRIISSNNLRIQKLEEKLSTMNSGNLALRRKLEVYAKQNQELLAQVGELEEEANNQEKLLFEEQERNILLNKTLREKNESYSELQSRLDKVAKDAYTAYYIAGTKKQLSKLNVLEPKKLPLLNIPVAKKTAGQMPEAEFEKIDKRDEAIIPLHCKKPILVTPHAKDSYIFQEDEDGMKNLCITRPDLFWQNSNYLVIQTK